MDALARLGLVRVGPPLSAEERGIMNPLCGRAGRPLKTTPRPSDARQTLAWCERNRRRRTGSSLDRPSSDRCTAENGKDGVESYAGDSLRFDQGRGERRGASVAILNLDGESRAKLVLAQGGRRVTSKGLKVEAVPLTQKR